MPSLPSTQTRLEQAKTALHDLMTGQSVVTLVDQNGERMEFRPANANQLRAYIKDLERQLGIVTPTLGPMRLVF